MSSMTDTKPRDPGKWLGVGSQADLRAYQANQVAGLIETTTKKPLGAALKAAREERGWSVVQLARRAGVSRQYVYSVEAGDSTPGLGILRQLAEALGVDWIEFVPADHREKQHEEIDGTSRQGAAPIGIRLVAKDIAAGPGALPDVDSDSLYYFREEWLRKRGWTAKQKDRFACIKLGSDATASSMIPTIWPQSVVLLDREPNRDRVKARSLWLVRDSEGEAIKRVTRLPDALILESDNPLPAYAAKRLPVKGVVVQNVLLARVLWWATEVD